MNEYAGSSPASASSRKGPVVEKFKAKRLRRLDAWIMPASGQAKGARL